MIIIVHNTGNITPFTLKYMLLTLCPGSLWSVFWHEQVCNSSSGNPPRLHSVSPTELLMPKAPACTFLWERNTSLRWAALRETTEVSRNYTNWSVVPEYYTQEECLDEALQRV